MAVEVRVTGAAQLRALAAHIKRTGDKGLGREMSTALTKAVAPIDRAITAEAGKAMPSGYRGVLTASLRHRRSTRTQARSASVRLTTTGAGRKDDRDLPALNAGNLRHPVFGRSRRIKRGPRAGTAQPNPWSVTRIRPGFYDRGIEKAADAAERQLLVVLDDFADRLAKG
jgi:hypothetical protein